MTGDGSQEMEHGRRMTLDLLAFYEDIEVIRHYTIPEITTLIPDYKVTIERTYSDIRYTGGMVPPRTIPSTIPSIFQRYPIQQRCPSYNAEYDPGLDPDSASVIQSHIATMPIPHISKPYEISRQRCNDL